MKIFAFMWFPGMKEDDYLIEDKRNSKAQKLDIHRNYKRHISPVSLLLWCKMVVAHCFVWPLALQLWSGSKAVRQADQIKGYDD